MWSLSQLSGPIDIPHPLHIARTNETQKYVNASTSIFYFSSRCIEFIKLMKYFSNKRCFSMPFLLHLLHLATTVKNIQACVDFDIQGYFGHFRKRILTVIYDLDINIFMKCQANFLHTSSRLIRWEVWRRNDSSVIFPSSFNNVVSSDCIDGLSVR